MEKAYRVRRVSVNKFHIMWCYRQYNNLSWQTCKDEKGEVLTFSNFQQANEQKTILEKAGIEPGA